MVDRRSTPDILAALGAVPREKMGNSLEPGSGSFTEQTHDIALQESPERLEEIINRATQSITTLGSVMGKHRLIDWLDEIRNTIVGHKEQETGDLLSVSDVAAWLRKHLGSVITIQHHLVTGRIVEHPYEVDVWARITEKQTRIDMWIECYNWNSTVKRQDVLTLVRKAVDVFYAAHADKKDFWFDRLMIVSSVPFDLRAIETARRYGITCVLYDGAEYQIESFEDWQRKPRWLKEAEIALDKLQG